MKVLSLQKAVRESRFIDGNIVRHPQSHFLDFVVDGRPLRDWFADTDDLTTALNRPWLGSLDEGIAELTGRRPTPSLPVGRVALLRCGECGDLGCGAVTAQLGVAQDTVTWSGFAWETDLVDDEPLPQAPGLAFVFDREAYVSTIEHSRKQVAAFPYDALSHHGRGFLWPWQWGWRLPKD